MPKYGGWITIGELPPHVRVLYNEQLRKIRKPEISATDRVWVEYDTIVREGQVDIRDNRGGTLVLTLASVLGEDGGQLQKDWKALENVLKDLFGLKTGRSPSKQKKVKYYRGAIPVLVVRQGTKNSLVEWEEDGTAKSAKIPNDLLKDQQDLAITKTSQPPEPVRRPSDESPRQNGTDKVYGESPSLHANPNRTGK